MAIDRRGFLKAGAAQAALAGIGLAGCAKHPGAPGAPRGMNPFRHGVASGDPLADRVILWTRVSPELARGASPIATDWWIARDAGGRDPVASGRVDATAERDYTVKVDAAGLDSGTDYYYRFSTAAGASPLGRTRTRDLRGI